MADALTIIEHCLAHAKRPIGVVVLDAGGHPMAYAASDGAPPIAFALARGRARGALGVGAGTSYFERMADARPHLLTALAHAAGGISGTAGGVLVRALTTTTTLACVGVASGTADDDEQIAVRGVQLAGFIAKFD